jgi:hypothetical protein
VITLGSEGLQGWMRLNVYYQGNQSSIEPGAGNPDLERGFYYLALLESFHWGNTLFAEVEFGF